MRIDIVSNRDEPSDLHPYYLSIYLSIHLSIYAHTFMLFQYNLHSIIAFINILNSILFFIFSVFILVMYFCQFFYIFIFSFIWIILEFQRKPILFKCFT